MNAGRHIGHGNRIADAALGHGDVVSQRRSAECAQVERQDDVPIGEQLRDPPGRFQLDPVPLPVIDGQCEHSEAGLARQSGADH